MENSFVDTKLRAANEQLTLAQSQLDAAIAAGRGGDSSVSALDGVSGNLKAARSSIDEISRQIAADTEAAPQMRACPACGKSIRAAATLCGHCWKKL